MGSPVLLLVELYSPASTLLNAVPVLVYGIDITGIPIAAGVPTLLGWAYDGEFSDMCHLHSHQTRRVGFAQHLQSFVPSEELLHLEVRVRR